MQLGQIQRDHRDTVTGVLQNRRAQRHAALGVLKGPGTPEEDQRDLRVDPGEGQGAGLTQTQRGYRLLCSFVVT